jgi:hypothetical protein
VEGFKKLQKALIKTLMCVGYCLEHRKFQEGEGYFKEVLNLVE